MQYIFDISEQRFFNLELFSLFLFSNQFIFEPRFRHARIVRKPSKTSQLAEKTGEKYLTVYAIIIY